MSATQSGQARLLAFRVLASGTNAITNVLPAVPGFAIEVVALAFTMTGLLTKLRFQDTSGTPVKLTGDFRGTNAAGGVVAIGRAGKRNVPLFSTRKGTGLDVVTTGSINVGGILTYYLTDESQT